jgi:hypothetical protein
VGHDADVATASERNLTRHRSRYEC